MQGQASRADKAPAGEAYEKTVFTRRARGSVRVRDGVRLRTYLQPRPRTEQHRNGACRQRRSRDESFGRHVGVRASRHVSIGRLVRQLSVGNYQSDGHLDHGKFLDGLRRQYQHLRNRCRSTQRLNGSDHGKWHGDPSGNSVVQFLAEWHGHDRRSRHSHGSLFGHDVPWSRPRNRDAAS